MNKSMINLIVPTLLMSSTQAYAISSEMNQYGSVTQTLSIQSGMGAGCTETKTHLDKELLHAAKDEAIEFVAFGEGFGILLQDAFAELRKFEQYQAMSDLELAMIVAEGE